MTFIEIFYLFIFYSFFGWLSETIIVSIQQKHLANTGFLDGPFSPLYGFGALAIIFLVFPFKNNLLLFFVMSMIIASVLEYLTSYIFEKIFKVSWWNYCREPFNLNGRICLETSLYWGILSVFLLIFVHPLVFPMSQLFSNHLGYYGLILFSIYFIIDATNTFHSLFKFRKILVSNLKFDALLSKKITRLLDSFPNLSSKIYNDVLTQIKSKLH